MLARILDSRIHLLTHHGGRLILYVSVQYLESWWISAATKNRRGILKRAGETAP